MEKVYPNTLYINKNKSYKMKKFKFSAAALFFMLLPAALTSAQDIVITQADLAKAGSSVSASSIGEPVGSVKLYEPRWVEATATTPAYGVVDGSIFPVDPDGWPINFRVVLPASWSRRSIHSGGGGMNGMITVREAGNPMIGKGFAIYGSDAGHQVAPMGGPMGMQQAKPLATGPTMGEEWALNEEAIRNLGYMQLKKTHDAAMVIIERVYGEKPKYSYFVGGSQGGREGLVVAQRYPADYDGIISDVPIVNFSTLMLAPEIIRAQEKPMANWVTPAKINTIRAEFLRQCDKLDGLADGIINNYLASRAIFDVTDGVGPADPWAALRAPNNIDPNPADTTTSAKLTNGQIKTLELVYSPYKFASPLANGVKTFGMWLPNVSPADYATITGTRYKGQEGAPENAPVHTSLGSLGVTGFLMRDLNSNPLDYTEGGQWNKRREEISEWLDATNPDLSAFYDRGGKILISIGTQDLLASSGAQLDYYQSLIDKMKQDKIDKFARLYVIPQAGHSLSGISYGINGEGKPVEVKRIPSPNSNDKLDLLMSWVEKGQAPPKTLAVTPEGRIGTKMEGTGYIICSYPEYPKYSGGPADQVSSYIIEKSVPK
jgi:pimeloyl-ACP methyl ester carboxylesterase